MDQASRRPTLNLAQKGIDPLQYGPTVSLLPTTLSVTLFMMIRVDA